MRCRIRAAALLERVIGVSNDVLLSELAYLVDLGWLPHM